MLLVSLPQLHVHLQACGDVAVGLKHVVGCHLADEHHAAFHYDSLTIASGMLELALPKPIPLQQVDKEIYATLPLRTQQFMAHAAQSFGALETVKALGAAVPKGDRTIPFPNQHRVIRLV